MERFSVPGNEYRIAIVKRYVHCAWVLLMREVDFYNIGYMGLTRKASRTKKCIFDRNWQQTEGNKTTVSMKAEGKQLSCM